MLNFEKVSYIYILIFSFSFVKIILFFPSPEFSTESFYTDTKVSREDAALYFLDGKVYTAQRKVGCPLHAPTTR